jgi:transposase
MSGSVSLIDGHIDEIIESNRCVCCGEVIPEGKWVCPDCLEKGASK